MSSNHASLPTPGAAAAPARMFQMLLAFLLLTMDAAASAEFFVGPAGADTNPGTEAQPFASPEAAREALRRLKQEHGLPDGGGTVWFRGGDYVRTNAFELGAVDSGTAESPIVWRAYRDEAPRWLGGRRLPPIGNESAANVAPRSNTWKPATDAAVLERFAPRARDHVRQCDLRALGITDFGEMKSRGFGRPTTPAHVEVFFAGRPMTLARWPDEGGFAPIAGFPEATAQGDDHGGKIGRLEDGFQYAGDRPRRWQQSDDLWVHGYWAWDWANSYEHVASLDLERRLVKTAPPHGLYGFRKGQRFYFLNVLEELDQPGEWYLDRGSGVLYFWPPETARGRNGETAKGREGIRGGEGLTEGSAEPRPTEEAPGSHAGGTRALPSPAEAILSLLDRPLLRLTEVTHVTFQGVILEATRGTAVEIHGGASNRIAGCLIRNIGNYGVIIEGGTGHGVVGCDVLDTGDGGVSLTGGDRMTLTTGGHYVENCHFQRQGRWSKCYVPAVLMNGVGMRASHNLIHDHPHCAILFNGNDHLIEFNEIHHIALETGDVGAIYTGRDYTYRGNRIRHNFIHHTGGVGMGSMGVYMDDCVSGTEVYGNVFYKVHWAMFIGGGRDHRVENNIFVECDPAVRVDGRGLDRSPVWFNMVNDFMRERLAAMPVALYRERYPAIRGLDAHYGPPEGPAITGEAFRGVPPEGNLVARNVCVGKWLEAGWHASAEMLRLESNRTNAVTDFVRLATDASAAAEFALRPESPAWQMGFAEIPLARIGLQPDEFRKALGRLTANGR